MSTFDKAIALQTALSLTNNDGNEAGLAEAFAEICEFLSAHPEYLSWRSRKNRPDITNPEGIRQLANKYFSGYRRVDFPKDPRTIPDEAVSIVMSAAYGYSVEQRERIKTEHQHAMSAENCVGALLERYLDSALRERGWCWCCGDFVKAVDFIRHEQNGQWSALQIKNRDNSENSSSSAIRAGTTIQKWFRSFSRKAGTNWENLPPQMQGFNLSEQNFLLFIETYLTTNRPQT